MKKVLLSLAALALTSGLVYANECTIDFEGDGDLYGLKRQTTVKADELEFTPEVSFSEDGVDVSIKNIGETGLGFALVNAGGAKQGLCVYTEFNSSTFMKPQITLTVPGGTISAFSFTLSGDYNNAGLIALDVRVSDGSSIELENAGSVYEGSWSSEEGLESVSIEWDNNYYSRFIHTISVTYTPNLGEKKECGLSFNETSAEVVIGQEYTLPELSNPNNLEITWSSTDENVATVDQDGKVTPVAGGSTFIVASTEGNDEFAAGNVRYALSVIPTADNLVKMLELAPEVDDRVYVNCPLTVTFANGAYAYVLDPDQNAGDIYDNRNEGSQQTSALTIYKVGQVIPAGWIATNTTLYESVQWTGQPGAVTETVEVVYPEVDSVTPEDVNKVVILKSVTFTTSTPEGNSKAYGTTPDGTRYEFQDTYNVSSKPAGTYDVTCIVRYSKRGETVYFYLSPISYKLSDQGAVEVELLPTDTVEARYFNLQGVEVAKPQAGVYVKVAGGKATKVVVK